MNFISQGYCHTETLGQRQSTSIQTGISISYLKDALKSIEAVSCTRSNDHRPPRCPPRPSGDETCGTSPAVITALLPSLVLNSP